MTIDMLQNAMHFAAKTQMQTVSQPRLGIVTNYDAANFMAQVELQPDGQTTGYLPIMMPWVGNGWGFFSPPSHGDQVLVVFQEGDNNSGLIIGAFHNNVAKPLDVTSGELWMVHASGSYVKLKNDGTVDLSSHSSTSVTSGSSISVTSSSSTTVNSGSNLSMSASSDFSLSTSGGNGTITSASNMTVAAQGALSLSGQTGLSLSCPVGALLDGGGGGSYLSLMTSAMISIFNAHTHNDPQGGTTSAPNQQLSAGETTGSSFGVR